MTIYQIFWDKVKDDLIKVFEEFFHKGVINGVTNATFICLNPKKVYSMEL